MSTAPWLSLADMSDPAHPYGTEIINTVSSILYGLSGRKFPGVKQLDEVYVCPTYETEYEIHELYPDFAGVKPYVTAPNRTISLHSTPVRKIISVYEGDRELDPSEYILVNRTRIVRTGCEWDLCSGVRVVYRAGVAPPPTGRFAAITLADELVRYFNGDPCSIGQGVQSVSRQGVDFQMFETPDFINGVTGLPAVDLFVHSVNPSRATMRAKVFSPHSPRRQRRY